MTEWKKLGDFSMLQKTRNRKHITENAYSITQAGLIPTKSFFKDKTNITSKDTSGYYIVEKDWFVYSPSRIDVGSISYLKDEGPVIVSPIDVVFSIDKTVCLPSYLLNYFFTYKGRKDLLKNREGVEGTGRRSLPFSAIENMPIPIPSLPEQERIVKALDTFTCSIENLKEQITQRRKQYEYYRDRLIDLDGKEGVELKEVACLVKDRINAIELTLQNYTSVENLLKDKAGRKDADNVPLVGNWVKYQAGDVLLGNIRPYLRKIWLSDRNGGTNGDVIVVRPNIEVMPTFLYYVLSSEHFFVYYNQTAKGGKMPRGDKNTILQYKCILPSFSEQQRIVSILDTFEASIRNLEQQLALRKKQYDYYRNQLLTFE